jgi:MinD-like ATPase involved in chromosome partitioning or flagellar assembly
MNTLVACWSAKGGSGVSAVATGLGLMLAKASGNDVLLVDLGGDLPTVLGLPPAAGPGVYDWLAAGGGSNALDNLAVGTSAGLRVLPRGTRDQGVSNPGPLVEALLDQDVPVVVDCGPNGEMVGMALAAAAPTSLLVIRPCFLALRRAAESQVRPTALVVVEEYGRVLGHRDIAEALGVPTVARVPWDPMVARAVDAGTLTERFPRRLARGLRPVMQHIHGAQGDFTDGGRGHA